MDEKILKVLKWFQDICSGEVENELAADEAIASLAQLQANYIEARQLIAIALGQQSFDRKPLEEFLERTGENGTIHRG